MSEILEFPKRVVVAQVDAAPLPEAIGFNHARDLEIIRGMAGFEDRIDYASQALCDYRVLQHAEVIDQAQFFDMAGRVRQVLAANLGDLTVPG